MTAKFLSSCDIVIEVAHDTAGTVMKRPNRDTGLGPPGSEPNISRGVPVCVADPTGRHARSQHDCGTRTRDRHIFQTADYTDGRG